MTEPDALEYADSVWPQLLEPQKSCRAALFPIVPGVSRRAFL